MNSTIFLAVALASFASGTITVKYASDSFNVTLLAFSLIAGLVLGWVIPPQFNAPVCLAVSAGGLVPIISRFVSNYYEAERKQKASRAILRGLDG